MITSLPCAGLIYIEDKKLLLAFSKNKQCFYLPGGKLDEAVFKHFENCDEVWHAGDFGNEELAKRLKDKKNLKGVYGNIDGQDIRSEYPEQLVFMCEDVKVMMRHIGGSPPKYNPETRK